MRDNVKFDVALEIISSKIAMNMKNKNRKEVDKLLKQREEVYLGNWDVINSIVENK